MNNNFFVLCRYFRSFGYDVTLYCNQSATNHFRPESDSFVDVSKSEFIRDFPYKANVRSFLCFSSAKVRNEFAKYDLIIACGAELAFLHRSGVRVDVFIPYGADLYQFPFLSSLISDPLRLLTRKLFAFSQRNAIRRCKLVIVDKGYNLYANAVERLGLLNVVSLALPMVYLENPPENDSYLEGYIGIIESSDFTVVNHARQYWCSNPDDLPDFSLYKGAKRNDRLIRAFGQFVDKCAVNFKPLLVLFEYGPDIDSSKALVSELGIESFVLWLPLMERKYILQILKT